MIKAAAIIPIRKQTKAIITISRTAISERLFRR
jgi:hypothetical protein